MQAIPYLVRLQSQNLQTGLNGVAASTAGQISEEHWQFCAQHSTVTGLSIAGMVPCQIRANSRMGNSMLTAL